MKPTSCGVLIHCQGKYLICKSTKYPNFGIPKGHLQDKETFKAAAIREVFEETGLQLLETQIVHFLSYSTKQKNMEVFFTSIDQFPQKLECTSLVNGLYPEVDEFYWLTKEEALDQIKNHMRGIFEKI